MPECAASSATGGPHQTAHPPPSNPIVTWLPSTITGTVRSPLECCNIRLRAAGSLVTSTYWKGILRLPQSSRAALV